jgi:two-component system sensor histidine kinase DegS
VSKLIADLRPTLLDTLGLVPAIRHYEETNLAPMASPSISILKGKTGIAAGDGSRLFRIVQTATGNILHHSRAQLVEIALKRQKDELVLTIADDGIASTFHR